MTECAVGLVRHSREIGPRNRIADKWCNNLDRNLGIGPACERSDRIARQRRPDFGHIEAAVAGEARERNIHKIEGRGLAPGRHVTHVEIPRTAGVHAHK